MSTRVFQLMGVFLLYGWLAINVMALSPDQLRQVELLNEYGYAALRDGHFEDARRSFEKALSIHASDKKARSGIGAIYLAQDMYGEARAILEPMLDEYPEDYLLKNNVAWLLAVAAHPDIRDSRRAIVIAQDALMLAPRNDHVWSTLAEAYFAAGNYQQALRVMNQAVRIANAASGSEDVPPEYKDQYLKIGRAAMVMSLVE